MMPTTFHCRGARLTGLFIPLTLCLMVAFCSGSCVVSSDSSLTIDNQSDYALMEINIAPAESVDWGPDLLPDWLYPGDSITIDGIDCDTYDVRIVDEDSVECIIYDVDFCFDDDVWVITNAFLDDCIF